MLLRITIEYIIEILMLEELTPESCIKKPMRSANLAQVSKIIIFSQILKYTLLIKCPPLLHYLSNVLNT